MATNPKDVRQNYYSLDEYFALEHAGDARYEYWDGEIYCMSGGSRAHGIISVNVVVALANGLRGGRCRAFTADTAIWTPTLPPYRYPAASVACGELQFKNVRGVDALINPVLLVEVVSPTSAARDHEDKFAAYQTITTLRDYLLIAQDVPRVTHYTQRADGAWERRDTADLDATLPLAQLRCELRLRDIYEGLTFPT